MNTDVTLTKEEFKVLHNSLCDLNRFCQFKEIGEIVERIRGVALKSAYEQDNRAFDSKFEMFHQAREQYGLSTTWSLYEVDNMTQLHDYGDAEYLVYDQHWGNSGEVVEKIPGRDWLSLYRAADTAIRRSGDYHHCFIEAFTPIKDRPGYLRLTTGS
jgi:hypothetical protein